MTMSPAYRMDFGLTSAMLDVAHREGLPVTTHVVANRVPQDVVVDRPKSIFDGIPEFVFPAPSPQPNRAQRRASARQR